MITWKLKITPISIATKEASIRAVRTDDTDPDNPMVYEISRAIISTQAQKLAVLDEIWDKHQIQITKATAVDNFVSGLETSGKTNLEARE